MKLHAHASFGITCVLGKFLSMSALEVTWQSGCAERGPHCLSGMSFSCKRALSDLTQVVAARERDAMPLLLHMCQPTAEPNLHEGILVLCVSSLKKPRFSAEFFRMTIAREEPVLLRPMQTDLADHTIMSILTELEVSKLADDLQARMWRELRYRPVITNDLMLLVEGEEAIEWEPLAEAADEDLGAFEAMRLFSQVQQRAGSQPSPRQPDQNTTARFANQQSGSMASSSTARIPTPDGFRVQSIDPGELQQMSPQHWGVECVPC